MSIGPVEVLVIKFPGNTFSGEIAPALAELVEAGLIRIFDILFASKGEDGVLTVKEIAELDDEVYAAFDPLVGEVSGLLTPDDIRQLTSTMENNSSAGLMLFENAWATRFRDAVVKANGEVLLNERVPRAVIDELLATRAVSAV
jgi:uncharacterized membrane protein